MKKHNRSLIVGFVALLLVVLLNIFSGGWVSPQLLPPGVKIVDGSDRGIINREIRLSGFVKLQYRMVEQTNAPGMANTYDSFHLWLSGLTHGVVLGDQQMVQTIGEDGRSLRVGISQQVDQYLVFKMFKIVSYNYNINMEFQADGSSSLEVSSDVGSPLLMNGLQLGSLLLQWLLIFEGLSYLMRFRNNKPSNS